MQPVNSFAKPNMVPAPTCVPVTLSNFLFPMTCIIPLELHYNPQRTSTTVIMQSLKLFSFNSAKGKKLPLSYSHQSQY